MASKTRKVDVENYTAGADLGEPTLEEIAEEDNRIQLMGLDMAEEPTLPGFMVSDEPLPLPNEIPAAAASPAFEPASEGPRSGAVQGAPLGYSGLMNDLATSHETFTEARNSMAKAANTPRATQVLEGDILPPNLDPSTVRYESRIRILEAWPYRGSVASAPAFVDRNWIGFADYDPVRQIEPGPCLRVPSGHDVVTICRPGDYIVRQETLLQPGVPSHETLEVWPGDQFQRLFIVSSPAGS